MPRVVWAEESKNGLRFEIGPCPSDGQSSCTASWAQWLIGPRGNTYLTAQRIRVLPLGYAGLHTWLTDTWDSRERYVLLCSMDSLEVQHISFYVYPIMCCPLFRSMTIHIYIYIVTCSVLGVFLTDFLVI